MNCPRKHICICFYFICGLKQNLAPSIFEALYKRWNQTVHTVVEKGNFAVLLLVSIWNFSYLDQEKAITVNQLLTVWGFVDIFISGMPWAITNCVPSIPVHDSVLLTVSGILAILQQQQQKDKTSKIIIQSDNKLSFKWSFQHFPCNEVLCSSWIWLIQKSLLPLFVVLPLNVLVLSLPIS